jgi:hypothetical protein
MGSVVILHSASAPLQICSPIMEISTWNPHDEHFIVGMKLDSRGIPAIIVAVNFEPRPVAIRNVVVFACGSSMIV